MRGVFQKASKNFLDPSDVLNKIGIEAGGTFADLGCGSGFFIIPAARLTGADGKVYAVDVFPNALEEVKSRAFFEGLQNIELIRADLEVSGSTGIKDKTVDTVLLVNILHQAEPSKVMSEAARILKKNGQIVVIDWKKIDVPFGPPKESRITPEEAKKLAEEEGLQFEKEIEAGAYHFGLVFKNKG